MIPTALAAACVLSVVGALLAVANGSSWVLALTIPVLFAASAAGILRARSREPDGRATRAAPVLAGVAGAVLALSPLAGGYYDSAIWAPAGLGVIALAIAAAANGARLTRSDTLAVGALLALAAWSLLSAVWADSVQQALLEGNRLFVYGTALGLLVWLARHDRVGVALLSGVGAGSLLVAGIVMVRALGADDELLLGGRLHEPLEYTNGQASALVLGLWPFAALAEQRRSTALAGAGLACVVLLAGLMVLAQSRGAVLALALSVLAAVALVPGRRRRLAAALLAGAGVGLALPALLDVYPAAISGDAPGDRLRDAGIRVLAVAAGTGLAWWGASRAYDWMAAARPALAQQARRGFAVALVAGAAAGAGVALVSADRIGDYVHRQYDAFVHLHRAGAEPTSRLAAGTGNRYDYWRIALQAWEDEPIHGVGAGGYDGPYFARRSTLEDVRQPHSLALQTLAELGIAGAALLGGFIAAIVAAARRRMSGPGAPGPARPVLVAATGMTAAWLAHANVDWVHLLPGLTGVSLCAVAILLAGRPAEARRSRSGPGSFVLAAGLAALAVGGSLSLGRQALAEHYRERAREALRAEPEESVARANRSLRLDPEDVATHYVKAAALARLADADGALQVLLDASRREPRDFVTWGLLGDLSVRRGELGRAGGYYGRASALNPRDRALRRLARDPRAAY